MKIAWLATAAVTVLRTAQVEGYPSLYASRRGGCTIPSQGYAAHGNPQESESISFTLEDSAAAAVDAWVPGETYSLEVLGSTAYAWIHASLGTVEAPGSGTQASACPQAWYSEGSAAIHTVQWTAPASVSAEGQCVVFSTAQAPSSRSAYETSSMEVCTEGAEPGTGLAAPAAASAAAGPVAAGAREIEKGLTSTETYRIVHGVLMLLGWGFLIPFAVGEAARKATDNWFPRHRTLVSVGLVTSIVGFIIAISLLSSEIQDSSRDTHRLLGYFIMALGVLQPINAYFRPHATKVGEKKEKKRFIWEVLHKTSGYFAVVLGFICIYLGIELGYSPIGEYAWYFKVVLAIFVLVTVIRWALGMFNRHKAAQQKTDALPTTTGPAPTHHVYQPSA